MPETLAQRLSEASDEEKRALLGRISIGEFRRLITSNIYDYEPKIDFNGDESTPLSEYLKKIRY